MTRGAIVRAIVTSREWTVAAALACVSCGPAVEPAAACDGRGTTLDAALARAEGDREVDCLVISRGSSTRLAGGRTTVVRARTVVIEGEATLAGAGEPGSPEAPWTSSGADCVFAHFNWESAARGAPTREVGAPGGAGATFVLRYGRVEGGAGRFALLRFDLPGGAGAPGRELRCGCREAAHAAHVARGPDGPAGPPGTWRFLEESL